MSSDAKTRTKSLTRRIVDAGRSIEKAQEALASAQERRIEVLRQADARIEEASAALASLLADVTKEFGPTVVAELAGTSGTRPKKVSARPARQKQDPPVTPQEETSSAPPTALAPEREMRFGERIAPIPPIGVQQ